MIDFVKDFFDCVCLNFKNVLKFNKFLLKMNVEVFKELWKY